MRRRRGALWTAGHGWTLDVPPSSPPAQLELLGVRRCVTTSGGTAHIMYKWRGEPLSVFVLPRSSSPACRSAIEIVRVRPRSGHLVRRAIAPTWSSRARVRGSGARRRLSSKRRCDSDLELTGTGTTTDEPVDGSRRRGRSMRCGAADGAVDDGGAERDGWPRQRRRPRPQPRPPLPRARARPPSSISSSRT